MPQTINLANTNATLEEQWNRNPGVPRVVTKKAGKGWLSVQKEMAKDLAGRENYRTPVVSSLPGGGSTTVAMAVSNSSGMGYDLFDVANFHSWRQHMEIDHDVIRRSRGKEAYFRDVVNWNMKGHASRTENLYSAWFYGNGGAALARIDPNSTINIGDTEIKLYLPRTAIFFEAERTDPKTGAKSSGDYLEFAVDDGTGGAGPKAYTPKVTAAKNTAGILGLSSGIPDDGGGSPLIQPGDYIFLRGSYGNVSQGLAAWCPADSAALVPVFNGVSRSQLPEKLGGLRIKLTAGQDPRTKWAAICKVAQINGTRFNRVITTPEEFESISNSVTTGTMEGKWSMTTKIVKQSDTMIRIAISVPVLILPNPSTGEAVEMIADEYFCDVTSGPADQSIYRGYATNSFRFHSTAYGSWWWVNYDGNGPLYQKSGSSLIEATYDVYGEYICEDPQSLFVAGPNVVP